MRVGRLGIQTALAGLLLVAGVSPAAAPMQVAAHRGGAALAPENSLAAFRNAVALGADALEFDVHLTSDGEPVVIHDATLDRTTTGHGAVGDTTLAKVRALHLRDRAGAVTAERVPTLGEVLDVAAASPSIQVLPEIKTGPGGRRYPGIEGRLIAMLQARGLLDERATVQAFEDVTLKRLHELEPTLRTMFLVSQGRVASAGVEAVEAVRWATAAGASDLGIDHRLVDARLVTAARDAHLRVAAWTVNEESELRRLADLGVDCVMSDRPDLALTVVGRPPARR
ncbi:MAG TPA: glycerophosphodiester phosphodiesterase family protein [Methylomirabilota bacterium]|nr:glycerophosphodiester phosphodiesterase family protein [Methylomirabilota bacterium]